jgi:ABC-type nitrate/sulfonate/bicarbonate transport system substrate-binding protein
VSTRDQSLFIATMGYHVGHMISVQVAREQRYYHEEGLEAFEFDGRGLLPRRFEREALALTMKERGVDIALGAGVGTAFYQRSVGADLYIVGGWRLDGPAGSRWYSRTVTDLKNVRGAKVGMREPGSMNGVFLSRELVRIGLDPARDVEWVCDPIFYGDNPDSFEALDSGRVDLIPLRPGAYDEADRRGLCVLLDSVVAHPDGRPGKVVVATGETIRERGAELSAFLRANIRAFWFVRDVANFAVVAELDAKARLGSHNADERGSAHLVTVPEDCETWPMPLNGGVSRGELDRIVTELVAAGTIDRPLALDDVLKDQLVIEAYRNVSGRAESQAALERNRRLIAKYGF